MIFQIADAATGVLIMTVAADTHDLALRYLEPGQVLYEGGPLCLDRSRLMIEEGALVQKPYVGPNPNGSLQGDGELLTEVAHG